MSRYQVTFKGQAFDVTVSGDSVEDVVKAYSEIVEGLKKALSSNSFPKVAPAFTEAKKSRRNTGVTHSESLTLSHLAIPQVVRDGFVETMATLTNWDTTFLLLHYAPDGLTNKELRSLSEELGKPISYSWLDTDFHRKEMQGFVVSRRIPNRKTICYFLAEPGKKKALTLVQRMNEKGAHQIKKVGD